MFARAYVEITNVCNAHCGFCHGTKRKGRFMSSAEFDLVCNKLKGHTDYICLHLMGEPLLHPELGAILDIAKAHGLKVCITTNGFLIPDSGDTLTGDRVYKLSVSLHSFEANGKSDLTAYLEATSKLCDRLTAEGTICALRLWNDGGVSSRNGEITDFLRERYGEPSETKRPGSLRLGERLFLENASVFEWPDLSAEDKATQFCLGLRDQLGVLCDGTVVPCCLDADGELALGDLFTQTLDDILSTDRARSIYDGFSRRTPSEELCRRCGYAQRFSK